MSIVVEGKCDEKFSKVRDAFIENFENRGDVGAALCIYHEGNIVDFLQSNSLNSDGIIINPGALTHYGISLRDGLLDSKLPIIEVHLSNIHSREEFRNRSVVSDISVGQIVGLGWQGYIYALNFLKYYIDTK